MSWEGGLRSPGSTKNPGGRRVPSRRCSNFVSLFLTHSFMFTTVRLCRQTIVFNGVHFFTNSPDKADQLPGYSGYSNLRHLSVTQSSIFIA